MLSKLVQIVMELVGIIIKPFSWVAQKLENSYSGPLRGLPQAFFVLGMAIIIFSPALVYAMLILLQLQSPFCYLAVAAWVGYIGFIGLVGLYLDYAHGKDMLKSLSKDFKWDIDEYLGEYLDLSEKQRSKRKKEKNVTEK